MKKRSILVILAIILMILPYFFDYYAFLRLLSYLLGLILFAIILFKNKRTIIINIIIVLTIFISSYFVDFILCYKERIPFMAKEVISSEKVTTYYSLIYQVNVCDESWNVDKFYTEGYTCEKNFLEETQVNEFLSTYESNKKSYLKIKGKISEITGEKYIELKPYDEESLTVNGNVNFKDDIILRLPIDSKKINIEKFKIYDEIQFVGRVDKKFKENELNIYLFKDVTLYQTNLYEKFDIIFEEDSNCKLDKTLLVEINKTKYYTSCLKNINIQYDENNIYNLDYVLIDEKIKLNDLLKLSVKSDKDINNNILYELEKLNVLVCNTNEVIFGKNITLENGYCEVSEEVGV